jgi:hypothetical protein
VYESNDYDLIKMYEYNRYSGQGAELVNGQEVDFKRRLKRVIKMLIKDNGFNPHLPIMCGVVNGKLMTYEGHTRLIACRELGINFYYEVDETLTNEMELGDLCYKLNNSGTKWNSKEKIAHVASNPAFTIDNRTIAKKVIDLSNTYGIALSSVLYIASNGGGHKSESLANKDFRFLPDTEEIIKFTAEVALLNEKYGLTLLKNDRFLSAIMKAIRNANIDYVELIKTNLLLRANEIQHFGMDRVCWNHEIQRHANFNLSDEKKKVEIK